MVVDPCLAPNVLEHRSAILADHTAVLAHEDEDLVKQGLVDVPEDPRGAVIRDVADSSLSFLARQWDTAPIVKFGNVADRHAPRFARD